MALKQILCAGGTAASRFALDSLVESGLPVTEIPGPEVGHLLLDVPSFSPAGCLRMGGSLQTLLDALPETCIVYGGNLNNSALQGYRCVDFLQDENYLAENAYITAECALDVALPYLKVTLRGCPVLIIGWGRIGKCLGQILKALGSEVTVSARKERDLAMLNALGFRAIPTSAVPEQLSRYRLIFNTVPFPVLSQGDMTQCREDCIKIELASSDGMAGEDIVIARGLPGIHLPESSGNLIARTFLKYYKEVSP